MKKNTAVGIFACFCFLLLILDAKTALRGAMEGVELCLQALVPSLFPFFVVSMPLTSTLIGQKIPLLSWLGRLTGMPKGSESLLLVGLLGGYPVGAQGVTQAYENGQISKRDARRLLGFCSNAGPAFLFGIVAGKFSSQWTVWALWGIHILSALITGMLLPGKSNEATTLSQGKPLTLAQALERSLRVMATVCGWVVLFRICIAFLDRWCLWLLPVSMQTVVIGALELANGCCSLQLLETESLRFVITSVLLSMGGVCVAMQTVSVTGALGTGQYFPGKLLQTLVSIVLAGAAQYHLFPEKPCNAAIAWILAAVLAAILAFTMKFSKKAVAFPGKVVYNREKDYTEVGKCSFGSGSKNPAPTASTAQS